MKAGERKINLKTSGKRSGIECNSLEIEGLKEEILKKKQKN